MNILTTRNTTLLFTALLSVLSSPFSVADDMEIFLKRSVLTDEEIRPNVSFILDTSGSMRSALDNTPWNTNTVFDGHEHNAGGDDPNYVYLYRRESANSSIFYYVNKVHNNNFTCTVPTNNNFYPDQGNRDRYLFGAAATPYNLWQDMCRENDATCNFDSSPTGPLVDCRNENVADDAFFPPDDDNNRLYAVNLNRHNWFQARYRFSVLQRVMRDLIYQNNDLNVSLMRFQGGDGSSVIHESVVTSDPTNANQDSLRDAIDDLTFGGITPLTSALWEAYRFMAGLTNDVTNNSVANAYVGNTSTYRSPLNLSVRKAI